MAVGDHVAHRLQWVLPAASLELHSFGRQESHARRDDHQRQSRDDEGHHAGRVSAAFLDDHRAQHARDEQRGRLEHLPRREDPVALGAVEGELRTQGHVGHFEDRVRRVEAEDRDRDPGDQRASFEGGGWNPEHQAEACQEGGTRVQPWTAPTPLGARTVAEVADRRVRHGVPELRGQEDRPDRGRRGPEILRGVLHVHDQDQHVAVHDGHRRDAVAEERRGADPILGLHEVSEVARPDGDAQTPQHRGPGGRYAAPSGGNRSASWRSR